MFSIREHLQDRFLFIIIFFNEKKNIYIHLILCSYVLIV